MSKKRPYAMIVEDDQNLSHIFSVTLQPDFETEVIADEISAIFRMSTVIPQLVVLDLNLPGLNGKTVLMDIRSDPRLEGIKVILCTADERLADTLREQADAVMIKPVSPTQLRLVASRFLPGN